MSWRHHGNLDGTWWQNGKFSALLVRGIQRSKPVTRSFRVFSDLRLNKRLNKQSRRRWFETPSRSLWRYCNEKELFFFHPVWTSVLVGTRVTLLHEQHALMELRLWLRQMRVVAGDFSILIESRRRNRCNNCLSVGTWHGVCSIRKGLLRSDRHE